MIQLTCPNGHWQVALFHTGRTQHACRQTGALTQTQQRPYEDCCSACCSLRVDVQVSLGQGGIAVTPATWPALDARELRQNVSPPRSNPNQSGPHTASPAQSKPCKTFGNFPKQVNPNIDPIYYSPYYGDPQKGTPHFGKLPFM